MKNQRKPMWELKQAASPNTLDLYIYGDVEGDGYDWFWGERIPSETSANHFRDELAKYPNVTQINIYINSLGGDVVEGTAIYNQLRRHTAHKTVYVDGFACSIASVIAVSGDEVVMPKNTMMMIHNMWRSVCGNPKQLRKAADDLDAINAAGMEAYLTKSGGKLTREQLVTMMDAETWLTAEQCIQYGLADRYAEEDADLTKAQEMLKNMDLALEQRVAVHKSIAAQLRQLTEAPPPVAPPPDPTPVSTTTNGVMNIFKNFKI